MAKMPDSNPATLRPSSSGAGKAWPSRSAVTPPPAGDYALLDPRVDNPLDFLWLDLNTGRYAANSDDEDSPQAKRADYIL